MSLYAVNTTEKKARRGQGRRVKLSALAALAVLASSALFSACASTQGMKIVLKQDSVVYVGPDKGSAKKRGENIDSENKPVLVESPGFASLYIIPLPGDVVGSEVDATLRPLDTWSDEASKKKINSLLNGVVTKMSEIQILMASGRSKEALLSIEQLSNSYPELTYLNFLRASCLVLVGEREKARAVLETALRDFPDNVEGRQLFKALRGNARNIPEPSMPAPAPTPAPATTPTTSVSPEADTKTASPTSPVSPPATTAPAEEAPAP